MTASSCLVILGIYIDFMDVIILLRMLILLLLLISILLRKVKFSSWLYRGLMMLSYTTPSADPVPEKILINAARAILFS